MQSKISSGLYGFRTKSLAPASVTSFFYSVNTLAASTTILLLHHRGQLVDFARGLNTIHHWHAPGHPDEEGK